MQLGLHIPVGKGRAESFRHADVDLNVIITSVPCNADVALTRRDASAHALGSTRDHGRDTQRFLNARTLGDKVLADAKEMAEQIFGRRAEHGVTV